MKITELRDWHATRDRWERWSETVWRRDCPERGEYEYHYGHPFPPTLDAADAAMPAKWKWERYTSVWSAWRGDGLKLVVPDTTDKIHDLYALSKLAWEQEAANGN